MPLSRNFAKILGSATQAGLERERERERESDARPTLRQFGERKRVRDQRSGGKGRLPATVTRWPDFLFNFWPYTTLKMGLKA